MAKYIRKTMSISTWKVKRCKLAPTVTALRTCNFACTNVRAKPFYVHENQSSPVLKPCLLNFNTFLTPVPYLYPLKT